MLSLLGLSFVTCDKEEELTLEQQDAADVFREKFYLWVSGSVAAVIIAGAATVRILHAIGLIA